MFLNKKLKLVIIIFTFIKTTCFFGMQEPIGYENLDFVLDKILAEQHIPIGEMRIIFSNQTGKNYPIFLFKDSHVILSSIHFKTKQGLPLVLNLQEILPEGTNISENEFDHALAIANASLETIKETINEKLQEQPIDQILFIFRLLVFFNFENFNNWQNELQLFLFKKILNATDYELVSHVDLIDIATFLHEMENTDELIPFLKEIIFEEIEKRTFNECLAFFYRISYALDFFNIDEPKRDLLTNEIKVFLYNKFMSLTNFEISQIDIQLLKTIFKTAYAYLPTPPLNNIEIITSYNNTRDGMITVNREQNLLEDGSFGISLRNKVEIKSQLTDERIETIIDTDTVSTVNLTPQNNFITIFSSYTRNLQILQTDDNFTELGLFENVDSYAFSSDDSFISIIREEFEEEEEENDGDEEGYKLSLFNTHTANFVGPEIPNAYYSCFYKNNSYLFIEHPTHNQFYEVTINGLIPSIQFPQQINNFAFNNKKEKFAMSDQNNIYITELIDNDQFFDQKTLFIYFTIKKQSLNTSFEFSPQGTYFCTHNLDNNLMQLYETETMKLVAESQNVRYFKFNDEESLLQVQGMGRSFSFIHLIKDELGENAFIVNSLHPSRENVYRIVFMKEGIIGLINNNFQCFFIKLLSINNFLPKIISAKKDIEEKDAALLEELAIPPDFL